MEVEGKYFKQKQQGKGLSLGSFEWDLSYIFRMTTATLEESYLVTKHLFEPLLLVVSFCS